MDYLNDLKWGRLGLSLAAFTTIKFIFSQNIFVLGRITFSKGAFIWWKDSRFYPTNFP